MKAITTKEKGALSNMYVVELPIPVINANQVLVKIKVSGINPADWKGVVNGIFSMPYIHSSDIAGIVEQVGTAITKFKAGGEVIGALEWSIQGAFAEYVATEAKFLVLKPSNASFAEAAAIPLAAITAWQGLFDVLNIHAGQKTFVQAAAGGVGLFALQLAKWKGAYGIESSSEKNIAFLKSLGADEVINYNKNWFLYYTN